MIDFDSNVNLVYKVYNEWYWMYAWLEDDLIQEGLIGLWKACKTFDAERGHLFSTYAVVVIKNEMGMFIRKESKHFNRVSSLDAKICEESGVSFLETITDEQTKEEEEYHKWVIEVLIDKAKELGFWDILECRLQGMKQVDIAKKLNIHPATVSERMKKLFIEARKEIEK